MLARTRELIGLAQDILNTPDFGVLEPELEDAPLTLGQLATEWEDCKRCELCHGRTQVVFGMGDPLARLMIVGEGPGAREDRLGEPFVGRSGELLDRMLDKVLELERSNVFITNAVKCRPSDNRNPLPQELEACRTLLLAQIQTIKPKFILALGTVALRALSGESMSVLRDHGQWFSVGGVEAIGTFHPAFLLRKPEHKIATYEDLMELKARLALV